MFCNKCRTQNADDARFCTDCGADLSKQTPPGSPGDTLSDKDTLLPGQIVSGMVLADRYEIVERLGSGGMGEVYKALDNEMDDMPVAIKVLPPILARDEPAVAGLRREAAISLKLAHPNVCRLHTFSSDGDVKFLVMEYIEGKTLKDFLNARNDRKLSVHDILPIAREVAKALDYAHSRQPAILHRDVKPANIMITSDGTAKVLDFGTACETKTSMTRVTGKQTDGTLHYMSPEQFTGKQVSPASDVYSFAATLYECFSGYPPFWQGSISYQLLNKQPKVIAEASKAINDTLQAALAKNPEQRPATATELVRMLVQADSTKILCERCGTKLRLHESIVGKRLKCPQCKHIFTFQEPPERPSSSIGQAKTFLRKQAKAVGKLWGKVLNHE